MSTVHRRELHPGFQNRISALTLWPKDLDASACLRNKLLSLHNSESRGVMLTLPDSQYCRGAHLFTDSWALPGLTESKFIGDGSERLIFKQTL